MKKEEIYKKKWYTIYRILSDLFSDKYTVSYIGVTSQSLRKRLYNHIHDPHSPFYKKTNLIIEPITSLYTDFISACKLERLFTEDYLKNEFPLQNQKYGNVASKKLQKEINKSISKALKGKPFTESHKQNLKEATKGKTGHKKGIKLSESHKKNISKGHIGIPIPEKSRKAFIEYNKDRYKPIIDTNTNIKYENIKDASIKLNIPIKDIRDNLHNRNNKYNFKFVEDLWKVMFTE